MTYDLSHIQTAIRDRTREETFAAVLGQAILSAICMMMVYALLIKPLKKVQENIRIYSSGDNSYKDAAYLKSEYNLDSPSQWIDVGALAGETGKSSDTIYGAPGIGYKIASRLISEYGTLDNLLESSKDALEEDIRNCGGEKELYDKVKSHEYKLKHHVKEMYAVSHKEVVLLARRLKAIRTFLDIELPKNTADWVALDQTFKKIGIPASTKMLDALTK